MVIRHCGIVSILGYGIGGTQLFGAFIIQYCKFQFGFAQLDIGFGGFDSGFGLRLGGFGGFQFCRVQGIIDPRKNAACFHSGTVIHGVLFRIRTEFCDHALYLGSHIDQFFRFHGTGGGNGPHQIPSGDLFSPEHQLIPRSGILLVTPYCKNSDHCKDQDQHQPSHYFFHLHILPGKKKRVLFLLNV